MLTSTGEFKVINGSPLIGKEVKDIEKEYSVNVVHTHFGLSEIVTRSNPVQIKKMESEEYLKVDGSYKNVMKVRQQASIVQK